MSTSKTNPPLTLSPQLWAHASAIAGNEDRHRTHCPMCSGEHAGDAEHFVSALYAEHAPWLTQPEMPASDEPDVTASETEPDMPASETEPDMPADVPADMPASDGPET